MNIQLKSTLLITFLISCAIACSSTSQDKNELSVPYGQNPETPSQEFLESICEVDIQSLKKDLIPLNDEKDQYFYSIDGSPFSGWAKEDFSEKYHRIRYTLIDSGFISWQIGYFTNGYRDCDFHMKNGYNEGSQRMWAEEGYPYLNTFSIKDNLHGEQWRWFPNGALHWHALFDSGAVIYEQNFDIEGRIKSFTGKFELPNADSSKSSAYSNLHDPISDFEQYFKFYFSQTGSKSAIRINTHKDTCSYTQVYADSISISRGWCNSDGSYLHAYLPLWITPSEVKQLCFELTKNQNNYQWSKDTSWYKEKGMLDASGCHLSFLPNDTALLVYLSCTE